MRSVLFRRRQASTSTSSTASASSGQARRAALVRDLNDDLSREFQAVVRYTQFAASVRGPFRHDLAALFRAEIPDEISHAHFLADKVVALGGQPTTSVPPVEAVTDPHDMVATLVEVEREDIERYARRAREAESAGEVGLKVQLEDIVLDETRHMEEMEKIVSGWP